jgi:hypothetical protein
VLKEIPPFPPRFPDQLVSYFEQAVASAKKHHDTRRHLFLNFLRESFNVDPVEVELEREISFLPYPSRAVAPLRALVNLQLAFFLLPVNSQSAFCDEFFLL